MNDKNQLSYTHSFTLRSVSRLSEERRMPDEFIGDPAPLQLSDYRDAAAALGCSVAAVRAVALVESAGAGFLADSRPKILFERHIFRKLTSARYDASHPESSSARRGGYQGGAREYDRLRAAMVLDRSAALQAASWGKFQVMGFNHRACRHGDVDGLVRAMVSGEPAQLAAFVAFIKANKLDDDLARCDWNGFARGYNGSAFAQHGYHRRIALAFARFAEPMPLLKAGACGNHVRHLQTLLDIAAPDGVFGPVTRAAVCAFQKRRKLPSDGIVGPDTWRALVS
jgi:hypothetical protein